MDALNRVYAYLGGLFLSLFVSATAWAQEAGEIGAMAANVDWAQMKTDVAALGGNVISFVVAIAAVWFVINLVRRVAKG